MVESIKRKFNVIKEKSNKTLVGTALAGTLMIGVSCSDSVTKQNMDKNNLGSQNKVENIDFVDFVANCSLRSYIDWLKTGRSFKCTIPPIPEYITDSDIYHTLCIFGNLQHSLGNLVCYTIEETPNGKKEGFFSVHNRGNPFLTETTNKEVEIKVMNPFTVDDMKRVLKQISNDENYSQGQREIAKTLSEKLNKDSMIYFDDNFDYGKI